MRSIKLLLAALVLLQCIGLGMWYHGLYIWGCEPIYEDEGVEVNEMKVLES